MLDGLVAIEGGRKTVYGEIFNDMPDRFADVVILVGAGYSIANFSWGRELGWLAAVLAVMTAYIRLLGGSMGVQQYFLGPMAKPHRMALLTAACVFSVFENYFGLGGQTMAARSGPHGRGHARDLCPPHAADCRGPEATMRTHPLAE